MTPLYLFENCKKINLFTVCPCLLESRELTVPEGHKFQKQVKIALNGDFGNLISKNWILNLDSTTSEKHVNIFYLWRYLNGLKLLLALSFFQKNFNNSKINDLVNAKNVV